MKIFLKVKRERGGDDMVIKKKLAGGAFFQIQQRADSRYVMKNLMTDND